VLAALKHPNVVRFVGFCVKDKKALIVMELMQGRSLHELLHCDPDFDPDEFDFAEIVAEEAPDSITTSPSTIASNQSVVVGGDGNKLDWNSYLKIARYIANGMNYLHSRYPPVLHRDLKPQNIPVGRFRNGEVSRFWTVENQRFCFVYFHCEGIRRHCSVFSARMFGRAQKERKRTQIGCLLVWNHSVGDAYRTHAFRARQCGRQETKHC